MMRRPMAKVRRLALFARVITETLSQAGVDMLLRRATALSEGDWNDEGRYYGSTMLTIDLGALGQEIQDPGDPATAQRLAKFLLEDGIALEKIASIARLEATRLARKPLPRLETDTHVRAEGSWIFIDVDVEANSSTIDSTL